MNVPATSNSWPHMRALLRDIRSPERGLAGQGVRFALAGAVVACVNLTVTLTLHDILAVRFQAALEAGFAVSIAVHFTLQRLFVWRHHEKFALAVHQQVIRYLGLCGSQYGLTALSTAQLPDRLGLPVDAVYLMTLLTLTGFNFVVFRGRVFHPLLAGEGEARE